MAGDVSKVSIYAIVEHNPAVAKAGIYVPLVMPVYVTKYSMYAVVGDTVAKISAPISFDYKTHFAIDLDFDYRTLARVSRAIEFNYNIGGGVIVDAPFDYRIGFYKDVTVDYKVKLFNNATFSYFLDGRDNVELDDGPFTQYKYNDLFTETVRGAWGLRTLLTSYTGPLVRIRDTSNNAEQDVYANASGYLNAFTVTGDAAVVKIYDQTGNGSDLVQATSSLQPLLVTNTTMLGGPSIKFDGVDDYMVDTKAAATSSASIAYLVSNPVIVGLYGAGQPREAYAAYWAIPHADGSNSSPYNRLSFLQAGTSSLDYEAYVRIGSSETVVKLWGMNNLYGWQAHAMIANLQKVLHPGVDEFTIAGYGSGVTYPNNTRLRIGGNGVGTENNGMRFVELVILEGSPANTTTIQANIDKLSHSILYGNNSYYKFTLDLLFNGLTNDGSIGEIEAHATAGGADLTYNNMPVMAQRRYSGSETWQYLTNDSVANIWAAGSGANYPYFTFLLADNAQINEFVVKARNDAYYAYTPKKWTLSRWTSTGWQAAAQIDMTADGNAANQVYTKTIDWVNAPPAFFVEITFDYSKPLKKEITFSYKKAMNRAVTFSYQVVHDPIYTELEFDYVLALLSKDITFSYLLPFALNVQFNYSIELYADATFNYLVDGEFRIDVDFDYKVSLVKDITFNYRTFLFNAVTFDYVLIPVGTGSTALYIKRLPEVPIQEIWRFVTKIDTSYDNTERRMRMRRYPRFELAHSYVIENSADYRHFLEAMIRQRNEDVLVAMHALTVRPTQETAYGGTRVYIDRSKTDIRQDDIVVFFDIGSEASFLRTVTNTASNYIDIELGVNFPVGVGTVVMPVRKMRFDDAQGSSMTTVYGSIDLRFTEATDRTLKRPGVTVTLDEFNGKPILLERPLADDSIQEAFTTGALMIDLAANLAPIYGDRPWSYPIMAKPYVWKIERGGNLDYWREFANWCGGSWKSFYVPSWRPDLVALGFSTSHITVDGNRLADVIGSEAFGGLMVTTNTGTQFVTVLSSTDNGDGTTDVHISENVSGSTINEISFIYLVRLSDDQLTFDHFELHSELTLNVRTVRA